MLTKPIEQIAKGDIEEIVTNEVRESRTLDYKEALPGSQDNDRKEFLRDVISFATRAAEISSLACASSETETANRPASLTLHPDWQGSMLMLRFGGLTT